MARVRENLGGFAGLDDLAILHHNNPIRDAPHDAQIVGDEQQAHIFGLFQLGQQLEDLRLNGDVQRGGRFIRNQQVGPVGKGHGDHHALTLTARQLVGIGVQTAFGVADADLFQQFDDARPHRIAAQTLVQLDGFPQLLFQRVQRVQRRHRLLKDKADVVAAYLAQPRLIRADHFLSVIGDRTGNRRVIPKQRDRGKRGHGFARPALAHEGHGFPAFDVERHALDRQMILTVLTETDLEIANL